MGGHAFPLLHCPRIPPDIYTKAKRQTTTALHAIFSHVVVPAEMPEKQDYGDIDFLVSSPLHAPNSTNMKDFDWQGSILRVKSALNTPYGRQGFKTPGCMYFAIRAPGHEDNDDYWIQVDLKVCFDPEMFAWETFELNYASNSKMIGSMMKPLGMRIDPTGLHIRVQEIEETNFAASMVWVSKDPRNVLRLAGLDRRMMEGSFQTRDEIYRYLADTWLFHPAHFAARLAEEQYSSRLEERSLAWTYFIKEWVPKHYPGYQFSKNESPSVHHIQDDHAHENHDLQQWYKFTRAAVREKVFTMFPHVATEYYTRRAAHVKEQEEQRLRAMITAAIPGGNNGWRDDFPKPCIVIKQVNPIPDIPHVRSTTGGDLTPPPTPIHNACKKSIPACAQTASNPATIQTASMWDTPLHLEGLARDPPLLYVPHPPPANFSPHAKLLCIARWTGFNTNTGTPYLLPAPRGKNFEMNWADAAYLGATDKVLADWAKEMWWCIWIRQHHTNYVGMWKKRFEKEQRKAEKNKDEDENKAKEVEVMVKVDELSKPNHETIARRLKSINLAFGFV